MSGKGPKTIIFARGKKQQEKENFQNIENGMSILALPPAEKVGTEMFEFLFDTGLSRHSNGRWTLSLCWDDQIDPFQYVKIERLVKDLYTYFEPAYGYAYQRLFKYGPAFYPFGVISGIPSDSPERVQITQWGLLYGESNEKYQTGMMRDIYRINFISERHFDITIEGKNLNSWIESDPRHGELIQIAYDLWSWRVEEDHINAIRQALRSTNMLVSYWE